MKLILIFLFLLSVPVLASDQSFVKKWLAKPLVKSKNNLNSYKMLKRFTSIAGKIFSIGNVNTFFYRNVKHADLANIRRLIYRGYKNSKLRSRREAGVLFIDGKLTKLNRNIKYVIDFKKNKGLFISVATYRPGYQDSIESEITFFQSKLHEYYKGKKSISLIKFIQDAFIPHAYAQGFGIPPGLGAGMDPGQIADLVNGIGDLNNNFDGLTDQLDLSNQNWADTNIQLGLANENWADANTQLGLANENWADTNAEAARANDLAEKLLDPKTVFSLGVATAAGAALGASVANLVIDGVVAIGAEVIDFFTDASGEEARWNKFQKAVVSWEEMNEMAFNAEVALDYFLLSGNILRTLSKAPNNYLTKENILTHLSFKKREVDRKKEKLMLLYEQTGNYTCRQNVSVHLDTVEKQVTQFISITKIIKKQTYSKYNDDIFCRELKGVVKKFAEAEAEIQRYRLDILNGRNEWQEHNEERVEDLYKTSKKINSNRRRNIYLKVETEQAENAFERVKKEMYTSKKVAEKRCQFDNNGNKRKFKATLACMTKYKNEMIPQDKLRIEKARQQRDLRIKNAQKRFMNSKNRIVKVDARLENLRIESYNEFFDKLEHEAACQSGTGNDCSTFMKSINSLERAKVDMKNICNDELMY